MKNKFNAKKCEADGYSFDSKKEMNYYLSHLKPRLQSGEISDLELQPCYTLHPGFKDFLGRKRIAITYTPDFKYYDKVDKQWVIVDVKGFRTDVYKIKLKLFLKLLPENTIFIEA
jgi:hypothetical protein